MIITIDGPSGTGKSTVARLLAESLKFDYLDSGAMYRGLAVQMLEKNIDDSDFEQIEALAATYNFSSRFEEGQWFYYLGEQDITTAIRTEEVTALSSKIATYPFVRKAMAALQRNAGKRGNLVCEGRDIGTVIFPDAQFKIFLTATPDIRAKRRFEEMQGKFPGQTFDLEVIKQSIIARDMQDANRELAPLKRPEDAHVIDTSEMTIDQVVEAIKQQVKS